MSNSDKLGDLPNKSKPLASDSHPKTQQRICPSRVIKLFGV